MSSRGSPRSRRSIITRDEVHQVVDRLPDSEITPRDVYLNRRTFMRAGLLAATAAGTALLYRRLNAVDLDTTEMPPIAGLVTAPHANGFWVDEAADAARRRSSTTTTSTSSRPTRTASRPPPRASRRPAGRSTVGGLVHKPRVFDLDDLRRLSPPEERIYRMRCVEAWSMVIPWVGYSLSKLLAAVEPMADAKYVAFETLLDPTRMPDQSTDVLEWPYVEGLRIDEAMHPLALLATGLYGQELPPQDGAPVRLVMPWKYGFKGIKSIVKITLTDDAAADDLEHAARRTSTASSPTSTRRHDHPRWSQATEQRIGEAGPPQDAACSTATPTRSRASTRGWISMSTSEPLVDAPVREAARRSSTAWSRRRCSCGTPSRHQLGVNEVNFAIRTTGLVGLVFLSLSLVDHAAARAHRLEPADRDPPQPRRARLPLHRRRTSRSSSCCDRDGSVGSTLHEIVDAPVPVVRHRRARADDAARAHLDRRHGAAARREAVEAAAPPRLRDRDRRRRSLLPAGQVRHPPAAGVRRRARPRCSAIALVAHYVGLRAEVRAARRRTAIAAAATTKPKFWSGELAIARIFDETHDVQDVPVRRRPTAARCRSRTSPVST